MKKKQTKRASVSKLSIEHLAPSIFEVANHVHHILAGYCAYCGQPMTLSDVNDYGSLCESCYMKEYY